MNFDGNITDNFKFIEKIGKGSFGSVYKIIDKNNKLYACKVENKRQFAKHQKQRLRGEYMLYRRFHKHKIECIPKTKCYIETPKQNLLVMELMGHGLEYVLENHGGKLDIEITLKLGVEIISHIEQIHQTGIIHRDIKPNNFMFGVDENASKLYIMDFGLSKMWCTNEGNHIEYKNNRSMIGTPRYASINVHMGIEPSRRDDMESIGYMLIFMATGSLPWQGIRRKTKYNPIDKIGEKKMSTSSDMLCEGLPKCFSKFIDYTRKLGFIEKPDYQYLRSLFIETT